MMNPTDAEIAQRFAQKFVVAGLGRRSIAAFIDAAVAFAIFFAVIHRYGVQTSETEWTLTGLPAVVLMAGLLCYWFIPEWFWGITLGKFLCGLKVLAENGEKCTAAQALKRNLLRAVDIFPFYLAGFFSAKFNPKHQRLGDQWARTIVVAKEKRPESGRSDSSPI